MSDTGANPEELGHASCMGPALKRFVERHLLDDLNRYAQLEGKLSLEDVRYDWSESCVEGHRTDWLDGELENFSGLAIFDNRQNLVAEGWMEFIETEIGLEVFWWFLRGGDAYNIQDKNSNEVPKHVWERLSRRVQMFWSQYAPNKRRLP